MKKITILSILFVSAINFMSYAQINKDEVKIKKFISKINNKNISYVVTLPVRFYDSAGKLIGNKPIVLIKDKYQKRIIKKYKEKMCPLLQQSLSDTTRDWACNIILYFLYKRNAVVVDNNNYDKINLWRRYKKNDDIKYWQVYGCPIIREDK